MIAMARVVLAFRQPERKSSFRDKVPDNKYFFFVNRITKKEVVMRKREALKKMRTLRWTKAIQITLKRKRDA